MKKIIWDYEKLKRLYLKDRLSLTEIGNLTGHDRRIIRIALQSVGVAIRNKSEIADVFYQHRPPNWDLSDLDFLYKVKNMSAKKISELKKCNARTILRELKERKIPIRGSSDAAKLAFLTGSRKLPPVKKGNKCRFWKCGRYINSQGYMMLYMPEHPFSNKQGYIAEHRVVMEKKIGRYLFKFEKVHHKGTLYPLGSKENKHDNREENLILVDNHSHKIMEELCNNCDLIRQVRLLHWQIKELNLKIRGLESQIQPHFDFKEPSDGS